MTIRALLIGVACGLAVSTLASEPSIHRSLTFEDRVAAQRAIEEVYWRHRIWPAENSGPKPALKDVMPDRALREKVRRYLEQSQALEASGGMLDASQLGSEIDRMEANSHSPQMLRELFDALANDRFLIAETLGRMTVVDRLQNPVESKWVASVHERNNAFLIQDGAASADRSDLESQRTSRSDASMIASPIAGVKGACVPDTWSPMSSAPDPRSNHTLVWTGTEMILWGGVAGDELNSGGRYNPATDTWSSVSTVGAPSPRNLHTAVWTGTQMVVWGGLTYEDGNAFHQTGGRYEPTTDSWQPTSLVGAPQARHSHVAVWTGDELIVWGGHVGSLYVNTGGRYRPSSDTWTEMAVAGAPEGRAYFSPVWTGSKLLVWGGYDGYQRFSNGGEYDPIANLWAPISAVGAPSARAWHSSVWSGSRLIVWGGFSGNATTADGALYDPLTDSWTPLPSIGAPSARFRHSAGWTGSVMVVWGGDSGQGGDTSWLATGARYSPQSNSWSATSLASVPSGRNGAPAIWTGEELILWGGLGSSGNPVGSGGRYEPVLDRWLSVSESATPSARDSNSAVWTGAEMIIWGGYIPGTRLGTGARYDPATDTWTPTSSINAPAPRGAHSAVWTGNEMIIWGGISETGGGLVGARYDVGADSWSPISDVGAPTPREYHTAVWTGTEMVIWGGIGHNNLFPISGGRYYPDTDTWLPTSATNVPIGRVLHSAVWTGSEILIWGGLNFNGGPGTIGDGGRYNPSNDQWATLPLGVSSPGPRQRHSAIWTGKQMVIWGGRGPSGELNSGARYDPSLVAWLPLFSIGAPSPRQHHMAVWTGHDMIVWSGTAVGTALTSGGRYNLESDSWFPISASNAPSGRYWVPSIWTGTQLLVWGGPGPKRSGGAYCVSSCSSPGLWYQDADGDGSGTSRVQLPACEQPENFVAESGDCDDSNSARRPGLSESCDGVDNDCDGIIDDGNLGGTVCVTGQPGICSTGTEVCSAGALSCVRIQDPTAETCNGLDDNCNGQIDEDSLAVDSDGDAVHNACDNCRFAFNPDQLDADGDLVGNACDNCVTSSNVGQQDLDSDQRGDVCDNCPAAYNPFQDDQDVDHRGDACDNCVFDFNPPQSDFDHDGQGDLCDVNDGLIYLFATDRNYIEWQDETAPSDWNVYEGSLSVLKGTGVYTQVPGSNPLAGKTCGVGQLYAEDFETLSPGAAKFALVTGITGGLEGSLGTNSSGATRPSANPCP